ncbi:MAG: LemA family protein [Candidatus Izemoplasmatales bacterium]
MITLMSTGSYVGLGAAFLAVAVVVWGIITSQSLRKRARAVLEAEAAVDHALTQRFATIAKLDETVFPEAGVERGRFASLRWQNGVPANASIADKASFAGEIDACARDLVAEIARRGASADRLVADLEGALPLTEEQLANARRLYNATAAALNKAVAAFPSMLAANAMRLEKRPYFEIGAADPDSEPDA